MLFILGKKAVKTFSRTIRFLAKYSNELYIFAKPDLLELKAVNDSSTVVRIINNISLNQI